MKNKKNLIVGCFILFVVLLLSNLISAQPYVDPEIEKAFEDSEWVEIFFKLENMSEADNLLSTFSKDEFEMIGEPSSNIIGRITKEGFEKLKNDDRVKSIYFNAIAQATLDETNNETTPDFEEPNNYSAQGQTWLWIFGGIILILIILWIILQIKNKKK